MRKNSILLYAVCILLVVPLSSQAQSAVDGTVDDPPAKNKQWAEDMDNKLDKAIAILQVLKEEVRSERDEPELSKAAGVIKTGSYTTYTLDEKIESAQTFASRAVNVWRKIMKALGKEKEARIKEQQVKRDAENLAKDIGTKLDASIKVMESLKKELRTLEDDKNQISGAGQQDVK